MIFFVVGKIILAAGRRLMGEVCWEQYLRKRPDWNADMTLREARGICLSQSHPKAVPASVQNQILGLQRCPCLQNMVNHCPHPL